MNDSLNDTQQSQQQIQLFLVQHHRCWCFLFTRHSFCLWEQPPSIMHLLAPKAPAHICTGVDFVVLLDPGCSQAPRSQGLVGHWWEAAALCDPRCSLCSQASALQHGALPQRGHLPGGGWRVPLHLPLPLHRPALRDRYSPPAPAGRTGGSCPPGLTPALCPQVSRTPAPRGPARTEAPVSTTSASTSVTVPQATPAGTVRSVRLRRVCHCLGGRWA